MKQTWVEGDGYSYWVPALLTPTTQPGEQAMTGSDQPYLNGYRVNMPLAESQKLLAASSAGSAEPVAWVSITERLPQPWQSVALINVNRWENAHGDLDMNVRACGYLSDMGHWSIRGERATTIESFTHWLALPAVVDGATTPQQATASMKEHK